MDVAVVSSIAAVIFVVVAAVVAFWAILRGSRRSVERPEIESTTDASKSRGDRGDDAGR